MLKFAFPLILIFYPAMKNICYVFSLLAGFACLLSGCTSVYLPNVPNVPMFTSKGELSAGAHSTLKRNVNFNTAYAVSDRFAVMLNGSMMSNQGKKRDIQHNLLELGGGYYTTFGTNGARILEAYVGTGRGSSNRIEKDTNETGITTYDRREANFNKYFLQVNYTAKKKKEIELFNKSFPLNYGTALRVSYLNMYRYLHNGLAEAKEDNIFLEPVFYTRLTLNPSVQLQYTSGSNFGLKNRKVLTAGSSVFSLGFIINVGGRDVSKK